MEITETTNENSISLISSDRSTDVQDSSEQRKYKLNEQRAVKKKLNATNREVAEITNTGGGVKINLNTGAYELLKCSAEEFYSGDIGDFSSQKIPVMDKKGHIVETKFKISCGKSPVYTLNMYHTKSSCLVNGKHVQHFIDNHLPQLINAIECKLDSGNTSVTEFNSHLRNLLSQCKDVPCNEKSTGSHQTEAKPSPVSNGSCSVEIRL